MTEKDLFEKIMSEIDEFERNRGCRIEYIEYRPVLKKLNDGYILRLDHDLKITLIH